MLTVIAGQSEEGVTEGQGKSEEYNGIIFFTVEILLLMNISLCVFHIPGMENTVADALS